MEREGKHMPQTTEKKTVKVTVQVDVEEQRISDLLCAALEGGVGYWCRIMGYEYPSGLSHSDFEFPHVEVVLAGGKCFCHDAEQPDSHYKTLDAAERERWTLTREKLEKGLHVMAEKYPKHFADFHAENDDAETGDVFLQCCLFGELVYG